ncbi:MAG: indole-3-glycerol phosphate synthase TrpC [archaeon]|nr:indole-3-glycerol phosphate synthase TrpC [archaeon]
MTANILEILADAARERTERNRAQVPLEEIRAKALAMECDTGFPFEKALRGDDIRFICECKKASPSKGLIAPDFPYLQIAREYEDAGAACISVLTEPTRFLGEDRFLGEIASAVSIPCIRKDFVVDEYMIYEAKVLGASAILLICAILTQEQLDRYTEIAHSLGLSVLCETHDEEEMMMALSCGARVIGVNNRNLKDFTVDINNCIRLRGMVSKDLVFVAESGIRDASDIAMLREAGVDAVLVGETLMRASDKKAKLDELRGTI